MPNADDITGWVVTPDADGFHTRGRHAWQTETFWASFFVPERKLSCRFYNQLLPNQGESGLCNGGALVWNEPAFLAYSLAYEGTGRDEVTTGYLFKWGGRPMPQSRYLSGLNAEQRGTLEQKLLARHVGAKALLRLRRESEHRRVQPARGGRQHHLLRAHLP
jgi:hypothetical protein